MGWLQNVRFSAETIQKLTRIIHDEAKARQFIRAAETAVSTYRFLREEDRDEPAAAGIRQRLRDLHRAADRYAECAARLTKDDLHGPLTEGAWLAGDWLPLPAITARLKDVGRGVMRVSTYAKEYLEATKPRSRGRPLDGPGILLIQKLVEEYKRIGGKVGTGENSRFVRIVEAVFTEGNIRVADVRGKIRGALNLQAKRGNNSVAKE